MPHTVVAGQSKLGKKHQNCIAVKLYESEINMLMFPSIQNSLDKWAFIKCVALNVQAQFCQAKW